MQKLSHNPASRFGGSQRGDVDVAAVVTAVTAVAATVALIGAPKLVMKVGVKIWGWIASVI